MKLYTLSRALILLTPAFGLAECQSGTPTPTPSPSVAVPPPLQLGYLSVPGASLYYEAMGSGPLLLFISGANGDADIWRNVASVLQANFTVAIYDRRGFSRSYLSMTAPQDYANRLATDANDARLLIEHLAPKSKKAYVLGNSSGAIVALALLQRYPDVLRTLIPHEPPAIMLLPDNATLAASQRDIYATYRALGVPPALLKFALLYGGGSAGASENALLRLMDPRMNNFISGNVQYWFEREFLPYPLHNFTLSDFERGKKLLLPAVGVETDPSALHYRTNALLAQKFGTDLAVFPGGHVGFATDPVGFGVALMQALMKKNGPLGGL